MKIAFLTLGCKLNYAETSTYERGFKAAGLEVVPWNEKADIYLVNTCSVTAVSDRKSRNLVRRVHRVNPKSRNLVRRVHRVNPEAMVVVTGCSAELRRSEIEGIEGVTRVFGANEKTLVVPETLKAAGLAADGADGGCISADGAGGGCISTAGSVGDGCRERVCSGFAAGGSSTAQSCRGFAIRDAESGSAGFAAAAGPASAGAGAVFAAYSTGERTRSFLKVQDGCDNFCAYCTVPYARGRSRNVPIAECVENARKIAAEGVKEIVLTGVNTGDFGRTTGESFLELLQALDAVPGIERYRISSIEPNLITEEIIDWIASGTKFQPHFHIPLQTGSDELLRRMGRKYDTALFAWKLEYIRRSMETPGSPKVFFGIDLMTGLPGETEGLFLESLGFLEKIRPAFIHVFPYSRRPGTPAASMSGQVPEAEKHRRVAVVEALCARLHTEFLEANRGVREKVLFESTDRDGFMEGYTGNYIRVSRPFDPALVGRLAEVVL